MMSGNLLQLICSLECELQNFAVRSSTGRLNELLHAEFREIGRSGRLYSKQEMLKLLPLESVGSRIESEDFSLRVLDEKLVLLTYRSARIAETGSIDHHALRSSIWRFESERWQIIFHQGTPVSKI